MNMLESELFSFLLFIAWDLCKRMKAEDVQNIIEQALSITDLALDNRPRLLSDNGSCYISKDLCKYLSA